MNKFAIRLAEIIDSSGLTIIQLSQQTGIERSTLYQYMNGRRRLKSRKHFVLILQQLIITPAERSALQTAWEIQLYGEELYYQKRNLEHFTQTLLTVEQMADSGQNITFRLAASGTDKGGTRTLVSGTAVEEQLFALLCSVDKKDRVVIMMQPNTRFLDRVLLNPAVYQSPMRLMLITRLFRCSGDQYQNLPVLEQILRIFSVCPDCQPLCYYSETDETRGTVVPQNIVLTDRAAMLIADDGSYAWVTEEVPMLEELKNRMRAMLDYCVPIGRTFRSETEEMDYLSALFRRIDFASRFELSGSFCTTPFFTADIIAQNINPSHPMHDTLAQQFTQMLAYVRGMKQEKPGTIISSVTALTAFAETGVLQDVPAYVIENPLSAEDRLTILTAMRQGILDGWYHLRLFREPTVMLDRHWDIVSTPTLLVIELFTSKGNLYFEFTEHTLVDMFTNYLQTVVGSDKVTTEDETLQMLERQIEKLREEGGNG